MISLSGKIKSTRNSLSSNMAHAKNFKDLTGQKIHRLTFLEFAGHADNGSAKWKVRCDCGTEFEVTGANVRYGLTKSCGCIRRERCLSGFKKFL